MISYEPLGQGYFLKYTNYRLESPSELDKNNIKFEGLMRGQLNVLVASARKPVFDSVEVVRLDEEEKSRTITA